MIEFPNPFQRQKQEEQRQFSKPTISPSQVVPRQTISMRFSKARTIESSIETDFRDLSIWKSHPETGKIWVN